MPTLFSWFFLSVIFLIPSYMFAEQNLRIFVGADTAATDSIFDSKFYQDKKRYGYEGYIGTKIGIEYFFTKKNGIRAFAGLGYANIKLLNEKNGFDLFSGVGTRVEVDYLFNYYSDEKFDFGFFVGMNYFNAFYKRKYEIILTNQVLAILGLNMTIKSYHRIEFGIGVPFFFKGRYDSQEYNNVPVNRKLNNLYYGISYVYLFDL
ncbi:outer membrane beta-barrel protein [Helicobacter sp. 13S00477-4]|uniref:outer membrane beta-barrel protein n=1 Tax=Helicobacter sp. 13S00477-4 TaxID=1905759 RepID=UPI000BA68926|nr:outer membrane beta-barrel protein [Helicobacter sp. 13S00477-4]PAF52060.1 hypothetical protein BKH44_04085 [Helicobacter sp. 13S00477-4]